jgi:hypothetical protein
MWLWMRRGECPECGGLDGDHDDDPDHPEDDCDLADE